MTGSRSAALKAAGLLPGLFLSLFLLILCGGAPGGNADKAGLHPPDRGQPPLRAPAIRAGDGVALIAPASPVRRQEIDEAAANLTRRGFLVKVSPSAEGRDGYLAGSDAARAEAVNRAFADPEVRLIICLRGGYGSPRILDRIDYGFIRSHPKVIVGFSDITALLAAIHQRTGLITFHGPMAGKDFSGRGGLAPYSDRHFFGLIGPDAAEPGAAALGDWGAGLPGGTDPRFTISGGAAEGVLVGGNLSTLASLMGTPFEVDTREKILFLEDVNEEPFRIDRMLCQLRLSGKLAAARGVLLGAFTNCVARAPKESLTLMEVLAGYFDHLGVPVLAGFPAGHIPQQATLPIGGRVRLDATARTLTILEPVVEERRPPPAAAPAAPEPAVPGGAPPAPR
jgi:muramoyltetrapeptide carboxypeptidase